MERLISVGQLRQNPTLRKGEVYTVTDRGEPIADIAPHRVGPWRPASAVEDLLKKLGPRGVVGRPAGASGRRRAEWPVRALELKLVLDTSVLIAADALPADSEVAIASITFAELAYGGRAATDPLEQALRQERRDRLRAELGPGLPFDDRAAAAFGTLCGLVLAAARNPRSRALDLMIAATAYANEAGVHTRKGADFAGVEPLVPVVTL